MKRLFLLILTLLLAAVQLHAAEESNDIPAPEEDETEATDEEIVPETGSLDGPATAGDQPGTGPSDEDFVPTVRITEDLPVAFPVDI